MRFSVPPELCIAVFAAHFKWKINNGHGRLSVRHRSSSIRQFGHSSGLSELRSRRESDLQRRNRLPELSVHRGDFNGDDGRRFDSD